MPTRGGRPRLPPALRGPGPLPGLCAGPQGSFVPRRPRNLPARAGSPRGRPLGPPPPPPPPVAVGPPPPPCSPRRSAAAACLLRHLRGHLPWVVGCLAAAFLILICVCVFILFLQFWGSWLLSARPRLPAAPSAPLPLHSGPFVADTPLVATVPLLAAGPEAPSCPIGAKRGRRPRAGRSGRGDKRVSRAGMRPATRTNPPARGAAQAPPRGGRRVAGESPQEGVPVISRKDSEMDEEIAIECG